MGMRMGMMERMRVVARLRPIDYMAVMTEGKEGMRRCPGRSCELRQSERGRCMPLPASAFFWAFEKRERSGLSSNKTWYEIRKRYLKLLVGLGSVPAVRGKQYELADISRHMIYVQGKADKSCSHLALAILILGLACMIHRRREVTRHAAGKALLRGPSRGILYSR